MNVIRPRAGRLLGACVAAGLGVAVLATSECAHQPIDFGPGGRLQKPEPAFEAVLQQRDRAHAVRGEAKAVIETKEGTARLTEFVAAAPPARLRLETVSFFGNPLAVLTSDGTTFALHDIEHRQFFQGPASAANVSRLLPVQLRPEDITSLVLGVPPMLRGLTSMKLEVDEEGRAYALTLLFRDRLTQVEETEVVGLEPITLRPLWVRMNAAAAITPFQATFENYDATLGLPRDIKVATAEPKARVELHWRDRELNVTVPADNFTQLPPPGVTPTELP